LLRKSEKTSQYELVTNYLCREPRDEEKEELVDLGLDVDAGLVLVQGGYLVDEGSGAEVPYFWGVGGRGLAPAYR
jgi:hypothetical protein